MEWREESTTLYMDDATLLKHVTVTFRNSDYSVHPTLYLMCLGITVPSFSVSLKDKCLINTPIENYNQMKIIFDRLRVQNPLTINTLRLALSYLMDPKEECVAYLERNYADMKTWNYSYYRALFRAMG